MQLFNPGDSPCNQVYLQSSWDLGEHWQFDLIGRYVDSLSIYQYVTAPSYIALDSRLAWHKNKNFEFAVAGRNLTRGYYTEFAGGSLVGPEVYAEITWKY